MIEQNKYLVWYNKIISRAPDIKPLAEGYESHHIIPKSCGGSKEASNIAYLTLREHYICHLLLTKIYVGKDNIKMLRAWWLMSHRNNIKTNSRLFSLYKDKYRTCQLGIKQSKATCDKRSKSLKNRIFSVSTRNKISKAKKGKIFTVEHCKALSQAQKGRKVWNKGLKGVQKAWNKGFVAGKLRHL